jgi:signal transduction histidine kinase
MKLEPAHARAGDAPRTDTPRSAPEQDSTAEREHWLWRRSIERQLHDGAALRISALTLQLGLFRHRVPDTDPGLRSSVDRMQDELHTVLQELRDVAGRVYPPLLDEAGLGPALREVADRSEVPVRVNAPDDRFGPAAEGAAYFAVSECVATVAADSLGLDVAVRREDGFLAVDVVGAGPGQAEAMLARVGPLGGTIVLAGDSDAAMITARIPCE